MKILIIEDEALLADSLRTLLGRAGFEVEVVSDGDSGAECALTGIYDLLLLDVMVPRLDGFSLARRVRAERVTTPILMLTARADVRDRIEGLNAGADYYLTKPFDNRELLACINALLRRQGSQIYVLSYGNTSLDLSGCTLSAESSVRLSSREFDVMRLLMQAAGRSVRKETLLTRVWGFDSGAGDNNVEVYIGFLRKKLRAISRTRRSRRPRPRSSSAWTPTPPHPSPGRTRARLSASRTPAAAGSTPGTRTSPSTSAI